MGEQEERQRPRRFRLVGKHPLHQPGEIERLFAEIDPELHRPLGRRVAFVEHEIDHVQHRGKPRRERRSLRDFIGDARVADLAFRARQALAHGCGFVEKGAGDLLGREPAERAQCQGNAGFRVEGRVAASKDQLQPLVGDLGFVGQRGFRLRQDGNIARPAAEPCVAPEPVDGLAVGHSQEPGARVVGGAGFLPVHEGAFERALQAILGELDVADPPDEGGEQAAVVAGDDTGQIALHVARPTLQKLRSITGRTSMVPCSATGIIAAYFNAVSRSGQSRR